MDDVCSDQLYSIKLKSANENADCDAYRFKFVDFTRESEAQDMINYFEEKSATAFELLNVDKNNQVFQIGKIENTRIGFKVRMKPKR